MEVIRGIIVFLYLLWESIRDLRKRNISLIGVLAASVLGILFRIIGGEFSFVKMIMSILPGLLLLLTAFVTRERVGYGDGLVMIGLGFLLGERNAFFVLLMSLFVCALWSAALMIMGRINRKTFLPFIPFYLVSGIAVFFLSGFF